jgi:hypothetical protein
MARANYFEYNKSFASFAKAEERYHVRRIEDGIKAIVQVYAPKMQAWMKRNRVWTDRTGDARRGLVAELVVVVGEMFQITMGHNVEYGRYLEFSNQGRYAVIRPALDYWGPQILKAVRRFMSG